MRYHAKVRFLNYFVLVLVAMTGGCHPHDPSGTCPLIRDVTLVQVRSDFQATIPGTSYDITDPGHIRELIAFANARRDVSQPSLIAMPAPTVTAAFYYKTDFVAAVGSGSDFFFVSCSNWKGVRKASNAEIADFERLIGYSK